MALKLSSWSRRRRALVCVLPLMFVAHAPVSAGDDGGFSGFQSPSGNIHCMYDPGDASVAPNIRCDIRDVEGPVPPRPRDCDLEWGRSYSIMAGDARGELICVGDAVFDDKHPVLGYGDVWQEGGFTCTSEQSGISCFNAKRHGFSLSRTTRKVF